MITLEWSNIQQHAPKPSRFSRFAISGCRVWTRQQGIQASFQSAGPCPSTRRAAEFHKFLRSFGFAAFLLSFSTYINPRKRQNSYISLIILGLELIFLIFSASFSGRCYISTKFCVCNVGNWDINCRVIDPGWSCDVLRLQDQPAFDCSKKLGKNGGKGGESDRIRQDFRIQRLVMSKQLLKMAIEIVDFPIKNGDFPQLCQFTRGYRLVVSS